MRGDKFSLLFFFFLPAHPILLLLLGFLYVYNTIP
jgi:hypothetical protein